MASRSRTHQGWPLLANSFRPFFLLAALQAAASILVWLPAFYGEISLTSAFAPRDWHVHEMLFGFLPAVITGFLFTAIPSKPGSFVGGELRPDYLWGPADELPALTEFCILQDATRVLEVLKGGVAVKNGLAELERQEAAAERAPALVK